MKRLAFLASLFGFGAAAQKLADPQNQWNSIAWRRGGKPLNGQCPTCGTMSAAPDPKVAVRMGLIVGQVVPSGLAGIPADDQRKIYASDDFIMRCHTCNSCFWRQT
jgi:hypothetical protein